MVEERFLDIPRCRLRVRFSFNHYARTGENVRGFDAGLRYERYAARCVSRRRRFCCECGEPIAVGLRHYVLGEGVFRIHLTCGELR